MYEALVFDTETTRIDDPEIIEMAFIAIDDIDNLNDFFRDESRFRPAGEISMGAMATHHIMEEDLVDCLPSSTFRLPETRYLIGHNVDFDWRAAGSPQNVKRICTLALCRDLWPEADSYSLTAMMYYLHRDRARAMAKNAHSAMADVLMCREILRSILDEIPCKSFEDLWRESEAARAPKVMPFGKHKGTPISEVPASYRAWLLGQDIDEYLRRALVGSHHK
ncbi:putative quorum-sensing-regulated virulence factor [Desulfuromonas acetoxidans]|uniref:putative quorum-sensing-regulated virulence factor n=1 Tax=Desulfuromonas acetoxidans TaxID=891 RepID=UPI00292E6382|nr:DUF3820 family protein [Desulfuromonas acetoxidans]